MEKNKKIKALALCLVSGCLASCGPSVPSDLNEFFAKGTEVTAETDKFKGAIEHAANFDYFLNDGGAHGYNDKNFWVLQNNKTKSKFGLVNFGESYQSTTLTGEFESKELEGRTIFRFLANKFQTTHMVSELKEDFEEVKPTEEGKEVTYLKVEWQPATKEEAVGEGDKLKEGFRKVETKEGEEEKFEKCVKTPATKEEAFHEVEKPIRVFCEDLIWGDVDDLTSNLNSVVFTFKVELKDTKGDEKAAKYEVKDLKISEESPNKKVVKFATSDVKKLTEGVKDPEEVERITLVKKAFDENIEAKKAAITSEVGKMLEKQESYLKEHKVQSIWSVTPAAKEEKK